MNSYYCLLIYCNKREKIIGIIAPLNGKLSDIANINNLSFISCELQDILFSVRENLIHIHGKRYNCCSKELLEKIRYMQKIYN